MAFDIKDLTCPMPVDDKALIMLAHGSGGAHMHKLLDKVILPKLMPQAHGQNHDSAVLTIDHTKLAFTTDSYVVNPLFFPGGDIGSLSIHGTVNDLAMSGAKPLYISVAFILEEGFAVQEFEQILSSMQTAAAAVGVQIVTGDTKVVERGRGHGLYINTAGIGLIQHKQIIRPDEIRAGDVIIVSGDIARHGIAIMAQREGLQFDTTITSDSAPVTDIVKQLLAANITMHCLRDITRGGLATTVNELAVSSKTHIKLDEIAIPIQIEVNNACELLGLDVLHVACEGRFVAFVPKSEANRALEVIRSCKYGESAEIIGVVAEGDAFVGVTMTNCIGVERIVDKLNGEQLPRIC